MTVDIFKILPHRYPFLMIDRILEWKKGESIKAIKNVSINEHFFMGHFPEKPVMPGVLIIEALAQSAGILMFLSFAEENKNYIAYLTGVNNMKFKKQVLPGDVLVLEVKLKQKLRKIFKFEGVAKVGDDIVAGGEITLALGE
ncbi:MAG: 3-hydroxyacyl-ACP dehydratase FabZ [Dictyoglomus sp.]|nr:3-hydroxyacyl-ACP dehydratase FabZ [Dictyoglomus sp.]MCX7942812.1 3-hydroxyacyl-ACP dehydratase FabZ [Dictyoglomaceae bacterium]MDW8188380.1 3-hydroxyacyl-ACP dehydratase FabZ [Dictyoglomus sp.]